MVMMIAITPSLKASSRSFSIEAAFSAPIGRPVSITSFRSSSHISASWWRSLPSSRLATILRCRVIRSSLSRTCRRTICNSVSCAAMHQHSRWQPHCRAIDFRLGVIVMDFALQPNTTSGSRFVELAENHATDFAIRAAEHDREGSFPFENIEAMQRSGVMGACVPLELAGLGVESLHDAMLGINRLGRGDGSTAIGAAMHLLSSWMITRGWRSATAAGDTLLAERMASLLRQ